MQKVECAKGFLTRRGESDLISDTNASPPASGVPLWLQMPRMCGTNPEDLVRFPPPLHLPSALNPPSVSAALKVLAFADTELPRHFIFFFNPALCPVAADLRPVPVCLWLIASPSLSLLCLPPAASTLIILCVSSRPGGDFNFCRTSPFPVLVFCNLPSSSSWAEVQSHLCSKSSPP